MDLGADLLTALIPSALQSAVGTTTGPCDADVDNVRRTNVFDAPVVTGVGAEIVEESFAAPQQDGHYRNMHFIDERSAQVLPDGGYATSDKDITVTGRLEGCTEGCFSPTVNEIKGCSTPHFDRSTRFVSEYEHRVMKGGFLSPPTGPVALAPTGHVSGQTYSDP